MYWIVCKHLSAEESTDYKFYLTRILYIRSAYEHIVLVQYREVAEVCNIKAFPCYTFVHFFLVLFNMIIYSANKY
jgi:hypothetical protein